MWSFSARSDVTYSSWVPYWGSWLFGRGILLIRFTFCRWNQLCYCSWWFFSLEKPICKNGMGFCSILNLKSMFMQFSRMYSEETKKLNRCSINSCITILGINRYYSIIYCDAFDQTLPIKFNNLFVVNSLFHGKLSPVWMIVERASVQLKMNFDTNKTNTKWINNDYDHCCKFNWFSLMQNTCLLYRAMWLPLLFACQCKWTRMTNSFNSIWLFNEPNSNYAKSNMRLWTGFSLLFPKYST